MDKRDNVSEEFLRIQIWRDDSSFQTVVGMLSCRYHRLHIADVASFSRRELYNIAARSPRDLRKTVFAARKPHLSEKWVLKASGMGKDEETREISRFPLVNSRKLLLWNIVAISKRYVKSTRIKKHIINRKDLNDARSTNWVLIWFSMRENCCSLILFF